jgi:hypothetical protein
MRVSYQTVVFRIHSLCSTIGATGQKVKFWSTPEAYANKLKIN